MTTLTAKQVALVIAANDWGPGGSRDDVIRFLDVALAVAKAESGWDTRIISSTGDYGLWQINKAAHPQYFTITNKDRIFDPVFNTAAAKKIYTDAGGWSPWSAYNSGAYKKYLGQGKAAYAFLEEYKKDKEWRDLIERGAKKWGTPGLDDPLETLENALPTPSDIASSVLGFVKDAGKTAGLFMLGVIILVIGLVFLLRNTTVGKVLDPVNKAKMIRKVVA